ncbi:MAG: sigma-70 family RNA polymerase sigma factor [Oscillospiraceae bacterium]|nr:sigma-70 family RNA polymerase sigma factor [Oscillospiraceae bacterium]
MVLDVKKIEAARSGDKDMFAWVYDTVAPDLYKVALYTLGNPHDAEDAVSETFIEAYRGIAKLRDPASFKFWIMKILSARCKRKIKEYIKNRAHVDIEDFAANLADASDTGGDAAQRVTVINALGMLTEQERLIVSLAVVQGYSMREVSAITGSPQGTVSSKLHRALGKLRKMVEQE